MIVIWVLELPVLVPQNNKMHFNYNYFEGDYCGGVICMKNYLVGTHDIVAPCNQVSEDIRNHFFNKCWEKNKAMVLMLNAF